MNLEKIDVFLGQEIQDLSNSKDKRQYEIIILSHQNQKQSSYHIRNLEAHSASQDQGLKTELPRE